ncbi:hypothetical protein TNCV_2167091 [Trichonephila clavipes]|nr:hypothetical protein TNCV_2167091 [Trichonephila clavipes]
MVRHMDRSDSSIRRCGQEWADNGRFQHHDGSGRTRATTDGEDRLMVRSAVTAPVSSDESRFQLCSVDHRRRVWRRPGPRGDPPFTIPRHTGPQPGFMVTGSDVVQSGRPIFDDFFQHLWPYIGNNKANVVFQMVKRLWLIRIGQ